MLSKNELPALKVSQNSILLLPPSLPFTFSIALALVADHNSAFSNPSNGILRVFFGMTLSVMFGDLEFRKRQIWRVYFARGVQKTIANFASFKNQWNSLHKCILICNHAISLEVFKKSELAFPPSAPCTFVCRRRPAWECYFCFCSTPLRRARAVRANSPALPYRPESLLMTPLMQYSCFCRWCH